MSETGETAWSSGLVVEAPSNPTVIFHRTPEPSTFPGPPTKPAISDVTETSVRLTWRNNANHGASPVFAYTVEYFSHETGEVSEIQFSIYFILFSPATYDNSIVFTPLNINLSGE